MGNHSGFPTRRTDSSDLSTRLKLSKLPSEADEKTKWQRRYNTRHYNPQKDKYELKRGQRITPNTRGKYHNKW